MDKKTLSEYKNIKWGREYFNSRIAEIEKDYAMYKRTAAEYNCFKPNLEKHFKELYAFYVKRADISNNTIVQIEDFINSLPEPEKTIIYKRYIEEKTLERIASEMFYCRRTIENKIKKILV